MSVLTDARRRWFIETALRYLGEPYLWGGDDPINGFDCSGYVLECLKSVGLADPKLDTTADGLWQKFKAHEWPGPVEGAVVFFFNADGKAYHVEICLDQWHRIGAAGGGSGTVSPVDKAAVTGELSALFSTLGVTVPKTLDAIVNALDTLLVTTAAAKANAFVKIHPIPTGSNQRYVYLFDTEIV